LPSKDVGNGGADALGGARDEDKGKLRGHGYR